MGRIPVLARIGPAGFLFFFLFVRPIFLEWPIHSFLMCSPLASPFPDPAYPKSAQVWPKTKVVFSQELAPKPSKKFSPTEYLHRIESN
jgi:hypothetical protein